MDAPVTERDLQRLVRYWQKRLRLSDWNVTSRFASFDALDGNQGSCDYNLHARSALILVLDPKDYVEKYKPEIPGTPQDIEDTVAHEVLHLHLAPWEPRGAALVQMEQAIESIAGALVSLKRRTKPFIKPEDTGAPTLS